jgi:hypothetical protein
MFMRFSGIHNGDHFVTPKGMLKRVPYSSALFVEVVMQDKRYLTK